MSDFLNSSPEAAQPESTLCRHANCPTTHGCVPRNDAYPWPSAASVAKACLTVARNTAARGRLPEGIAPCLPSPACCSTASPRRSATLATRSTPANCIATSRHASDCRRVGRCPTRALEHYQADWRHPRTSPVAMGFPADQVRGSTHPTVRYGSRLGPRVATINRRLVLRPSCVQPAAVLGPAGRRGRLAQRNRRVERAGFCVRDGIVSEAVGGEVRFVRSGQADATARGKVVDADPRPAPGHASSA